jgi:ubiquinone/menaquinone biosynthesis C-methylase UbiE
VTGPGDDEFPDWQPAPNIRDNPALYELENTAFDPDGLVLQAMREAAPWAGRRLVDLGCGNGFWLPGYAAEATDVVGVEPDSGLLKSALARVGGLPNVRVGAGSAEHVPLDDASVDVVHARFAYFFGPGAERGLTEVMRVLAPGGSFIAIDNDHDDGEFADVLRSAATGFSTRDQQQVERWWAGHGARQLKVRSQWRFTSHDDLANVLRNEFRDGGADTWLAEHPDRRHISYGFCLYVVARPAAPRRG